MISIANSRIAAAEFGSVRGINAPMVGTENTVLKRSQLKRSPAGYAIRKCAVNKHVREHAAQRDPGCEQDLPLESAEPLRDLLESA
jgi:hypothetical protein